MYIYIYMHVCNNMYVYIYIYIHNNDIRCDAKADLMVCINYRCFNGRSDTNLITKPPG